MRGGSGLIEVSVGGHPPVWFCVEPDADDPMADELLAEGRFDDPATRLALDFVRPGSRVLDLGAGVGVLALPAAGRGAEVVAVDRSPAALRLLAEASTRNGFDNLRTVGTDEPPGLLGPSGWPSIDAVLEVAGWTSADVVRLDVRGAEGTLLDGARCLRGADRPGLVLFRARADELEASGSSSEAVRERLGELGYAVLLADPWRPGLLVEARPDEPQPANDLSYLAVRDGAGIAAAWTVGPPLGRDELLRRVADTAAVDVVAERVHAAVLAGRLRHEPALRAVRRALELDVSPVVRRAAGLEPPVAAAANHAGGTRDSDSEELSLVARGLDVRAVDSGFERPAGTGHPDELAVSGLWLHVRPGTMIGVLSAEDAAGGELLAVLAGRRRPSAGELHLRGEPLLVSGLDRVVEPRLSLEENVVVLGAFFGAHAPSLAGRAAEVARQVAPGVSLDRPLGELGTAVAARLALVLALEAGEGRLLLLDRLPEIRDPEFRRWSRMRLGELRHRGASLVQVVSDLSELLDRPDRLLWLAGREVVADGHPESVAAAFVRRPASLVAGAVR